MQALLKSMLHELMTGRVRVAQHGYTDRESRIRVIRVVPALFKSMLHELMTGEVRVHTRMGRVASV